MLAPVTPPEAVRDLFLSMGLGAWLCAGYTLLRAVLGSARWAVFTCDALFAFGALVAWRAAAVSIFYAGVPRWYTLCGMAAAFLALRGLMAAPARRLRASCAGIVRRATGPLAALAAPVRQMAHNWRAAAGKMRADGKWRTARGKKHGPLPTKQLQKSARVLYNSE
ncbi:MAG: hypothetical protein DBY17_04190 [Oscillospiraceae bacterium]|jgi:hypothetical protein|nr:MAG: hypothetical protein DBY17_05750 [Oscillospiraceae bacterium]PWL88138.1 MAG: hypothetical protein DBY17_04190 [Oscillospiraceae bacterium]